MRLLKRTTRVLKPLGSPKRVGMVIALVVVVIAAGGLLARGLLKVRDRAAAIQPPLQSTVIKAVRLAPRPTRPVTFAEGCVTAECHASMSNPRVHAPVSRGECRLCHQPDAGGHTYPLARDRVAICALCHQEQCRGRVHGADSETGCLTCHNAHAPLGNILLIAATPEKNCASCHLRSSGNKGHQSYAAGRCDLCHDPHQTASRGLLGEANIADHCKTCHPRANDAVCSGAASHRDIKGSCLGCHEPHTSNQPHLLASEPRRLCVTCHESVGKVVATAVVSHDAVLQKDQCLSCHDAHSAVNPMMLRANQADVCLRCHNAPITAADGRKIPNMTADVHGAAVVHGPVAAGNCSACHSVHGATHAKLLNQVNPQALAGGFDIRNYALCFSCHDSNLATGSLPGDTQFRNGDVNLHKLHLASPDRSRTCSACHSVHGAERPRLIADAVAYDGSDWKMNMNFTIMPDGGSCSPGCHEPRSYRRSTAGAPVRLQGGAP